MASKLFKNGTIITFSDEANGLKVLQKASLLITNDRITAIEEDPTQLPRLPPDTETIDLENKILSPGFINTHFHSWQTAFRSLAPDVFLAQYFSWLSHMSPQVASAFEPEDVYWSALQGYLEGLNAGVTGFVEHAHNNWRRDVVEPGFEAALDAGARVWWCFDVLEREGFGAEEQWGVLSGLAGREEGLVKLGLSLDGSLGFSAGEGAVEKVKEMAGKLKLEALTAHHLGGAWPSASGPQTLAKKGLTSLNIPVILSHASHLTDGEITTLRAENIFTSITPESELSYGHGQTTGHLITDQASLGIDTNHTYSGDLHYQARLWLQFTRNRLYQQTLDDGKIPNANPFPVEQAFLLATRQGGRALRRDDIGVIRVGAKADIAVFDGDSPSMLGWTNAVAAVLLHANAADVEHVIVGGQWRKRDFRLVDGEGFSLAEVKARFVEAAKRIQGQMREPPELGESLWGVAEFGDVEKVSTLRRE